MRKGKTSQTRPADANHASGVTKLNKEDECMDGLGEWKECSALFSNFINSKLIIPIIAILRTYNWKNSTNDEQREQTRTE